MADVVGRLVVKLESDDSGVDDGIAQAKGKPCPSFLPLTARSRVLTLHGW